MCSIKLKIFTICPFGGKVCLWLTYTIKVKISKHIPILFHAACLRETIDLCLNPVYCLCELG